MTTIRPLVGKQLLAVRYSTARVNVYEGSVRSSKTVTSLIDWIRYCRNGPPGALLMTGRTERTVINNLVLPILDMLGPHRVKINLGNGTVNICGRNVILIGANNESARTKIQGLTLAGAYADEAPTLPESYWNMLFSRLSVPGAQLFATGNPESPHHWFKRSWLDRAKVWVTHDGSVIDRSDLYERRPEGDPDRPLDLHRFSFILDDNPSLDPEFVAALKSSYTGVWYKRFVLGLWVLADGAVYEAFDETRHRVPYEQLPGMARVLALGIDYGTTNPTAGLLVGLGVDRRLYVIDEWAPVRGTDAELSASLTEWLRYNRYEPEWVFVDPAAASFKLQLYRDDTARVADATNEVVDGIRTVAALLSTDQLAISARCERLLSEIHGYVWDSKASEKGIDKPVKIDDHFCDALRYAVVSSQFAWFSQLNRPIPAAKEAT
ncbi:PBSX family phage terminase large subunit [Nocardia terpenica]|uniref:PBSX family phage terminase large subunit n=1 Tax=Nocardia terpenica TaxID=455432 RepID=UPI000836554E|nr:PBSX family phage terminase large subunit [Nocardia terpenica]NQE86268.1 PBSX family phage terminase large subunit [Nocardia terpenica]